MGELLYKLWKKVMVQVDLIDRELGLELQEEVLVWLADCFVEFPRAKSGEGWLCRKAGRYLQIVPEVDSP